MNTYLKYLCSYLIKNAQSAAGIKNVPQRASNAVCAIDQFNQPFNFRFYSFNEYEAPIDRVDAFHIVISGGQYRFISYTTDYREPPFSEKLFAKFKDVVLECVNLQKPIAIRNSMKKDKNYNPIFKIMTSEEYKKENELYNRHKEIVEHMINSRLDGIVSRFFLWQIEKLSRKA